MVEVMATKIEGAAVQRMRKLLRQTPFSGPYSMTSSEQLWLLENLHPALALPELPTLECTGPNHHPADDPKNVIVFEQTLRSYSVVWTNIEGAPPLFSSHDDGDIGDGNYWIQCMTCLFQWVPTEAMYEGAGWE